MTRKQSVLFDFLIPLVILLGFTLLFWMSDLDLSLQRQFFVPGEGWIYADLPLCRALYEHGTLPALFLSIVCLLAFIGSFWKSQLLPYRNAFLFLVLLMLIGPGLVVNSIFKEHWGRPRPRAVVQFGGKQTFLTVWQKGESGKGSSFPSGHASMGFFLLSPYFVLRHRSKKWAWTFLGLGLGYGLLMGLVRMVQGGHFASDVLWAGGMVYLCALGLYYLLHLDQNSISFDWPRSRVFSKKPGF
ncbi:MAG: phosphatase PAP2 family protein [Candidatus Vecturithrix sp.]|jgi:membrane-associated PAP2 superfamily phosphatase|nr:phosphatase PAP2 family protein [Candidatus Vecturithrix sp.]